MTVDLVRLAAAQARADEVAALVADHDGGSAPRLLVAVIDPETNTRLATAFVAYSVPPVRHLRLADGR